VLGLTETWLNASVTNSELSFANFAIHRLDRGTGKGGGLCLLVSKAYHSVCDNIFCSPHLELLHVNITRSKMKPINVILIYRSPSSSLNIFISELEHFLNNIDYKNNPLLLMGDFNHDMLKIKEKSDKLSVSLRSYSIKSCHRLATRTTLTSSTCLDLVAANGLALPMVSNFLTFDVGCSDHCLVTFKYKKPRDSKTKTIKKRTFRYDRISIDNFRLKISFLNLRDYSLQDFMANVNYLHDTTFTNVLRTLPKKSDCNEFLSNKFTNAVYHRDKALKAFKISKNTSDLIRFKNYRRKASIVAKADRKKYYCHLISNAGNNPKKVWRVLKKFTSKKPVVDSIPGKSNSNMSTLFNSFFIKSVTDAISQQPVCKQISSLQIILNTGIEYNAFNFKPCSPPDILFLMNKFKVSSVDDNYIYPKILSFASDYLALHLCDFINKSFIDCFFPTVLKAAKVMPIHKKGSLSDLNNYRPISILSTISKVYESIALRQINWYFNSHNLWSSCQFGFQSANSTETAIAACLSKVYSAINCGIYCIVIFLDFSKAFDTVNHLILCDKLKNRYNFSNNSVNWIHSYLVDRSQYVTYNGISSSTAIKNCGVPQGGILSPTLFKIYTNDMEQCLVHKDSSIYQYADDTTIIVNADNPNSLISKANDELDAIYHYCVMNNLILNLSKTKGMVFNNISHYCFDHYIVVNNYRIDIVNSFKYLGVYIDDNLKFSSQIHHICGKLSSCNYVLSRTAQILPVKYNIMIYNSLALSHIIYSKCLLLPLSKNSLLPIQKKIIQAGSIIHNCLKKHVCHSHFDLNYILHYYFLVFLYKIMKCNFGPQILQLFNDNNHSYNTRNKHKYFIGHFSKAICKNSFPHLATMKWNSLDVNIKNCTSLSNFKCVLSQFLQSM